jgi:ABC-type branched-subunit amino acid transport system ATPase component
VTLLEVERVTKSFGGVRAVNGVSFTLARGEVLGVMGPNGSGKTTLFNLVAGACAPDAGSIRLAGEEIAGLPPHRVCARGVARTFQLVRPFPGLTVADNVRVGRLFGRAGRERRDEAGAVDRLLALVGLEGRGHLRAATLTVMDRKRVELARALATSPHLLLLDEFMAGLTPAETAAAMALVRRLQGEGLTLVLVEHIVWALLDLSHRIMVLSAGEKIADGAPATVAADPTVVDVYLGAGGHLGRAGAAPRAPRPDA